MSSVGDLPLVHDGPSLKRGRYGDSDNAQFMPVGGDVPSMTTGGEVPGTHSSLLNSEHFTLPLSSVELGRFPTNGFFDISQSVSSTSSQSGLGVWDNDQSNLTTGGSVLFQRNFIPVPAGISYHASDHDLLPPIVSPETELLHGIGVLTTRKAGDNSLIS